MSETLELPAVEIVQVAKPKISDSELVTQVRELTVQLLGISMEEGASLYLSTILKRDTITKKIPNVSFTQKDNADIDLIDTDDLSQLSNTTREKLQQLIAQLTGF